MSQNDKVSNVFGDRKEELVTMPFSEKKSLTKNVEKGPDKLADMLLTEKKSSTNDVEKGIAELVDMKQAVNTIFRKGLDQFEGKSKGSKRWFKLDSGLKKKVFSTSHRYLRQHPLLMISSPAMAS